MRLETSEDLRGLLGLPERKHLEFKQSLPPSRDSEHKEFVNDVSSFANSEGGDLLYGVRENPETHAAEDFVGIPAAEAESSIARLENIVRSSIQPRLPYFEIHPVDVGGNKTVVVLRVGESHLAPHQNTLNHRFYARNTNGKYPMAASEVRDMVLRRASMPEQMRNFRHSRISLIREHPEDMPTAIDFERRLVVHYLPERTFGRVGSVNAAMFTDARFRNNVIQQGSPTYTDSGLSWRSNIDGFVFLHGRAEDALKFYVQVFHDGSIEFLDASVFRTTSNEPVIYHENLELSLFRQYTWACAIFATIGIDGPVTILAGALGVRDFTIKSQANTRILDFVGHSTAIGRDPALFNPLTIEDLQSTEPVMALEPLVQQIWQACAYDRAYSYKDGKYTGRNW